MSITRQLFNEFRPLFRMLEGPLGGRFGAFGVPPRSILDDPFFNAPRFARPAVDVSEDGNQYIVETELPGVKKEDVEVRIGDGGRSVTIEGNIIQRRGYAGGSEPIASDSSAPRVEEYVEGPNAEQPAQASHDKLAVERSFTGSSRFTRTIWLPRPGDTNGVLANLADGVLTLKIPKAEENDTVKIKVE
ncbi:HSP20-like chaperone [Lactarius akahatsu]|uniref:HSP20-like chaperone n=1 Tax=Lactarius akahatsu TaxID=416441 RepID=A0AAD4LNS0_9AGAM|nr:HSP20-like chaperone [Lactarius akahatsu]